MIHHRQKLCGATAAMKFVARGRVVSGEARGGVFGSTVEFFADDPSQGHFAPIEPLHRIITNRDGAFSFTLRIQAVDTLAKKAVFVRPIDDQAQALAEPERVEVASGAVRSIEFVVDPGKLAKAALPPQPKAARLVPRAVFDTIHQAIDATADAFQLHDARLVAQRLFCALPPVNELEDLLDVAEGVLRGRPEDMRRFQEFLDGMDLWNQGRMASPRQPLGATQAQRLLSPEVLKVLIERHHAVRKASPRRQRLVPAQSGIMLLMAATRVAANDPVRIHRNLATINDQFSALRGLEQLFRAARAALSGSAADQAFFSRSLHFMGGCTSGGHLGHGPWPSGPGGPVGGDGGSPGPFEPPPFSWPVPQPGGSPFWPPDDPADVPSDFPIATEDCTAEAVAAFREVMERGVDYTITGIELPNACPGQEVTIRGTNLQFEGRAGVVLFAGRPRGTKVLATPTFQSPTEVRVVVPEGAGCGDIELQVPGGAATVMVCEATIDLFRGPSTPFHFDGGATTIERFTASRIDGCLRAGDVVTFLWATCNADFVRLDVMDEMGDGFVAGSSEPGRATWTVPALDRDTRMTALLRASGPCGADEERLAFTVQRGTPLRPDELIPFGVRSFSNWHGNVRRTVRFARPTTLQELVATVLTAEQMGLRLGVEGSAWSYTDCVVPAPTTSTLVDSTGLTAVLNNVIPFALRAGVRSVLSPAASAALNTGLGFTGMGIEPLLSVEHRLVHVEAGIKLFALNCVLDLGAYGPTLSDGTRPPLPRLALPTMGGDKGQSIAGAINTGTHGTNVLLPPIADFVRAPGRAGGAPVVDRALVQPHYGPGTDGGAQGERRAESLPERGL